MVPMELNKVVISETSEEQVIVLKEINGARSFPIVIGIWEAVAIDRNLKNNRTPRPMTHDLIENVIKGLDARLESVIVNDLRDRTFFAKLMIRRNGKRAEVDSRPSDAIALAVLMKAPIYVEESVLEKVIQPSGFEGEGPDIPEPPAEDDDE